MYSVGIDMIEISRIKNSIKNLNFLKRILSEQEYKQLNEKNFIAQSVAINFCAKEAFLKLMGLGLGGLDLKEIELLREKNGKPYLNLKGKALDLARKNELNFSVSATHTREYASVVIIAYSKNKCQ